eukprot:2521142-Rhodomonas_salina.1
MLTFTLGFRAGLGHEVRKECSRKAAMPSSSVGSIVRLCGIESPAEARVVAARRGPGGSLNQKERLCGRVSRASSRAKAPDSAQRRETDVPHICVRSRSPLPRKRARTTRCHNKRMSA